jgi:hypothetical protein
LRDAGVGCANAGSAVTIDKAAIVRTTHVQTRETAVRSASAGEI